MPDAGRFFRGQPGGLATGGAGNFGSTFPVNSIESHTFPRSGQPSVFPHTQLMTSKRNIPTRRFIKPTFEFLIEKKRDGGEFNQEEIR